MQISIKPICDWRIYFTASADERLACIKQTSLLTSLLHRLWIHFLQLWHKIELLLTPFLHALQGNLPYSSALSFIPQPNITFVSISSSNPGFHCTVLSRRGYWHQTADERHGNPPQGNQELLVVKDKAARPPGEL